MYRGGRPLYQTRGGFRGGGLRGPPPTRHVFYDGRFSGAHGQGQPPGTTNTHMHGTNAPGFPSGFRPRGVKRCGNFHPYSSPDQRAKRPKTQDPKNFAFYCDTCDRGFKTSEKHKEHTNEHVKCEVEGCPYVACAKLVSLHVKIQHNSGIAKKIWQLESKEDIAKWIAERRKNFPTAANIAKKKEINKQKAERGEVLEDKYFGKMRGRGGRGRGKRNRFGNRGKKYHKLQDTNEHEQSNTKRIDSNLDPLSFFLDDNASDDNDKIEHNEVTTLPTNKAEFAGGLGSIVAAYGSDSDEESTCGREEKVKPNLFTSSVPPTEKSEEKPTVSRPQQYKKYNSQYKKSSRRTTLLQKLLAPDIRHERNVILQCIRHIVNNQFYGLDSAPPETLRDDSNDSDTKSVSESDRKTVFIEDDDVWDNDV